MLATLTTRFRLLTHLLVSVLAFGVLLPTLPFTSIAAISSSSGMSCCVAGSGHCDSGIIAATPATDAEPTCAGHDVGEIDENTIVVEETVSAAPELSRDNDDQETAIASLSAPCPVECCQRLGTVFRKPKFDFASLSPRTLTARPPYNRAKRQVESVASTKSKLFSNATPRGPPCA